MSDKLIYRGKDNQIKDLAGGSAGQFLVIDRMGMAWKELAAATIPYADPTHHGLENIEAALTHVLKLLNDLATQVDLSKLAEIRATFDKVQSNLTAMQKTLDALSSTVAMLNATGDLTGEENPATSLTHKQKALTRHLAAPGTYGNDDSRSRADSVHSALDELYNMTAVSITDRNTLRRDKFGALYAEPITVTNRPHVAPITMNGQTINIAPAQVAHICKPEGINIYLDGGMWALLNGVMQTVIFDSLATTDQPLVANGYITARREGYYFAQVKAENLKVSVAINGEAQRQAEWRGRLNAGDQIDAAVWSDEDRQSSEQVDLFVQLIV